MAVLNAQVLDSGYVCFEREQAAAAGARYADAFAGASPFPHVVIDDFLDSALLGRVIDEFPTTSPRSVIESESQRSKLNFMPSDIASGFIRNLLAELTQEAILEFIGAVTGLRRLIPDPYFTGGGLHETKPGGYLAVHADFNLSQRMRLQRRVNLIVYLNDDWPEAYGGHLELWDRKAKNCAARILPVLGRAIVFETGLDGFHGHPQPLACPAGRSRRSIAVYYYAAPERGIASLPRRAADFRSAKEPGSNSSLRRDWKRLLTSLAVDATPPIIYRALRHMAGRGD